MVEICYQNIFVLYIFYHVYHAWCVFGSQSICHVHYECHVKWICIVLTNSNDGVDFISLYVLCLYVPQRHCCFRCIFFCNNVHIQYYCCQDVNSVRITWLVMIMKLVSVWLASCTVHFRYAFVSNFMFKVSLGSLGYWFFKCCSFYH